MAQGHGNNCLQHVIEKYSAADLCKTGMQQRLENEFKEEASKRLSAFGIEVLRVMVLSVRLPHEVQAAIETAKKRELIAESDARALELLKQALKEFDEKDMHRLTELERLRVIGQSGGGGGLAYLLASMLKSNGPNN
jgi:regulator of protease activity HflC (stomatin/prohibitin superfamily)